MTEFIGLAYFAEVPAVIFNVQRGGPSTGMPTRTQQSDLLSLRLRLATATPSTCCCSRRTRKECFDFTADALDLADRLQTPVFVMTDLDIGMNHRLCEPFAWDDKRGYDRGKVMTAEDLEAGKTFGRYLDVDGDGIPFRTYPGTHPTKGSYFTRGTTKDEYARYSEEGAGLRAQHGAAAEEVRHGGQDRAAAAALLRAQGDALRRDLLRLDQPGHGRGARPSRGATASTSTRCACAPSRSRQAVERLHRTSTTRCSSSSRTATRQLRSMLMNELHARRAQARAGAALRRHADHGALHRRPTSPRSSRQLKVVPFEKAAS